MKPDRYVDFLVFLVCACSFSFLLGMAVQASEFVPKCDGTPFNSIRKPDGSISCYYKLDRTSYQTTTISKKGK